jgi:hypothetical protein
MHSSDDGDDVLGQEISFLHFCADWKDANLWTKWTEYASKSFDTGESSHMSLGNTLTSILESIQSPLRASHSKRKGHPIEIGLDSMGVPILPPITIRDWKNPYLTKDVQDMVRDYCTAHARKSYIHR